MSKQHQGSLERIFPSKQAEQHAAPSLPRPGVSRTDALLTASEVFRLQRTLGNRATGQLVQLPRHQSGSYRRITPPKTIIQPKFSFSGQDFEEAEQLLRSTPFTKREMIDGDMKDVHLEVIFGDFGKYVYGTTKMSKEEQTVTIKIDLTTLKEEDKDKFLGRILETFLHEWELHGLNYIKGRTKVVKVSCWNTLIWSTTATT